MAMCAMRTVWRVSGEMSRFSSIYHGIWQNVPACLNVPNSTTTHIQKRSLFASLGGTTALFVGASVLTVVETALFVVRHVVDFAIGKKTGRIEVLEYKP